MLPLKEALPADVAESLTTRFNIRSVEQFLALMNDPTRAAALGDALGRPVEELAELARAVAAAHPEVAPTPPPPRRYPLGHGKDGKQ